jgi:hypothetical protein
VLTSSLEPIIPLRSIPAHFGRYALSSLSNSSWISFIRLFFGITEINIQTKNNSIIINIEIILKSFLRA